MSQIATFALTADAVRVAIVATVLLTIVARLLLPGPEESGRPRGLEDAVVMAALLVAVTTVLAVAGLLDPISLMVSLLLATTLLSWLPGRPRRRTLARQRAIASRFFDVLERRSRLPPRLGISRHALAGPVAAAVVVAARYAWVPATPSAARPVVDGYEAAVDELGDDPLPTIPADDPSEVASAFVAGIGNTLDVETAALAASSPSLALAAATATTIFVVRRITARWVPALGAGLLHAVAVEWLPGASSESPAVLDSVAVHAASAMALLAAALMGGNGVSRSIPLAAPAAVGLAAGFHPVAGAIACCAGLAATVVGRAQTALRRPALEWVGVPVVALAVGVALVGVDGTVPDGILSGAPQPLSGSALIAAAVACAGIALIAAVMSRRRGDGDFGPSLLAVGGLAAGTLAAGARPGTSSLFADATVVAMAAPSMAALIATAIYAICRPRDPSLRRGTGPGHAAAQPPSSVIRSAS